MFKDILKDLIDEKRLTIQEFSKQTKTPKTTIDGWLYQKRKPDFESIKALSQYFNVSADYLLGLSDEWGNPTQSSTGPQLTGAEKQLLEAAKGMSDIELQHVLGYVRGFRGARPKATEKPHRA